MKHPLVDRIYEAAVIPELWRDACEMLAVEAESSTATLLTLSPDTTYRWVSTANVDAIIAAFASSEARFDNIRPARALAKSPGFFVRDTEIMSPEELLTNRVYQEFIYPNGLERAAGCAILEPSGHVMVVDLMRKKGDRPFSDDDIARMNLLKPDLARAAFMSSRLSFQQAATYTSALSLIGLPAAVIGDLGSVVAMNLEMEAFAPVISTGAGNALLINRPAARQMFEDALQQLKAGDVPQVQSIPLPASDEFPAIILHLVPVRRMARDVFGRSIAVLIATPIGDVGPPDMRVLSGLFDLTPAEARVAREIAIGASLEIMAANLGLSIQTVRTYLKRVMSKTGTRRQAELAVLLSGLARLRSPEES